MGKVVRNIAIGAGVVGAGLVTGGAAWLAAGGMAAGAGVMGGLAAASAGLSWGMTGLSAGMIGAQYLMNGGGGSSMSPWLMLAQAQQQNTANAANAAAKTQPPTPIKKTIRQSDAPRCFLFGRVKTAGSYFFYETDAVVTTTAGAPNVTALNLYQGIYICDGPIDGFDTVLCDDEALDVGSTGDGRISDSLDGNDNVFIPRSGTKYIRTNTTQVANTTYYNEYVYGYYLDWAAKLQLGWHWETRSTTTYTLQQININQSSCVAYEPVNGSLSGYGSYILNTLMPLYSGAITTGLWSGSHVGKGVTCIYTFATNNPGGTGNRLKYFPNAWPEWSAVVRGARVYDPRKSTHQFIDTRSHEWTIYNPTWEWTENPALIAAHFISWLISCKTTAITGVDWDAISTAADDCDALKLTTNNYFGGGTSYEPFSRITGAYYFNTSPRDFLSNIMAACDGTYGIDQNGKFTMWVGKWEEAAVIFDETDIGGFSEEFVEAASEAINEFHIYYTEARNGYQRFEAPTWIDNESQLLVGKRMNSISFDMVPSANQAYRLAQRYARRINGKKKLTITLGPRGMLAIKQRVVGINAPNFGISGTWRIESLTPDMSLRQWQATLREITADVFADEPPSTDPIASLKIVAQTSLTPPTYYSCIIESSGTGTARVIITADVNTYNELGETVNYFEQSLFQDQTLSFDARYSLDGGTTWYAANIMASKNTILTPSLKSKSTVSVQARWVAMNGTASAWSDTKTVTIP